MGATVLLVEDERKLREFVRSYLERAGHTVLSTGSGAEAISLARSSAPDLIILDLGLPDVPGEAVAREIRAAGPVPILMLTAKSGQDDRISGLELGADDYVTKPFSPRELVLRVQAILRRGVPDAAAAADVSRLVIVQQAEVNSALEVAAVTAWERGRSWADADLGPLIDVASQVGIAIEITDPAGRQVASSPGFTGGSGEIVRRAVLAPAGTRVGTLVVRYAGSDLGGADRHLRIVLLQAIAAAAGLAAVLALLMALGISRRITRPVRRLIEVARSMAGGDVAARVGELHAPAELRELAATFDRMADALGRQEQLRRDLLADVAHELRTPVAVLQAGHEALQDGLIEPTADHFSSLRDEGLRLVRMVDDLQTLAEAGAAALELDVGVHNLAEVADGAADSLASQFDAAEVILQRQLAAAAVLADTGRLHQIITNLLSNAMKFTTAGGRGDADNGADRRRPGGAHGAGYRRGHPAGRTAVHLRQVLARPAGKPGGRQRHRPGRGRRAGASP